MPEINYRVENPSNNTRIIFEKQPAKYAIVIETPEEGERILLPQRISQSHTYYAEGEQKISKKNEKVIELNHGSNIKIKQVIAK